jgi:hypothetical protein
MLTGSFGPYGEGVIVENHASRAEGSLQNISLIRLFVVSIPINIDQLMGEDNLGRSEVAYVSSG